MKAALAAGTVYLLQDGLSSRIGLAVRFGGHEPPAVGCVYASQQPLPELVRRSSGRRSPRKSYAAPIGPICAAQETDVLVGGILVDRYAAGLAHLASVDN
mgnify:CR=1 FL=1|jgi:hypothetical protein